MLGFMETKEKYATVTYSQERFASFKAHLSPHTSYVIRRILCRIYSAEFQLTAVADVTDNLPLFFQNSQR